MCVHAGMNGNERFPGKMLADIVEDMHPSPTFPEVYENHWFSWQTLADVVEDVHPSHAFPWKT